MHHHTVFFSSLQTSKAMPFIIGCPACQHNFIQLWCVVTCSPDQASFMNISAVQQAADNNATVVKTVDVWLSPGFMGGLYDSCKVCSHRLGSRQSGGLCGVAVAGVEPGLAAVAQQIMLSTYVDIAPELLVELCRLQASCFLLCPGSVFVNQLFFGTDQAVCPRNIPL